MTNKTEQYILKLNIKNLVQFSYKILNDIRSMHLFIRRLDSPKINCLS